jgi:hypothetical protein
VGCGQRQCVVGGSDGESDGGGEEGEREVRKTGEWREEEGRLCAPGRGCVQHQLHI